MYVMYVMIDMMKLSVWSNMISRGFSSYGFKREKKDRMTV